MAIRKYFESRRLLFSGIAASLGLASVVAPVITSTATAEPVEGPGPIQPSTISPPGTYQPCTAYFGLTKDNSDLLSFEVDNINNAVSPTPVIGTDIVPILTVTDGTQSFECIPDLGWTDEDAWRNTYFTIFSFGNIGLITYPGTGYYLMPAVDGTTRIPLIPLIEGESILPTASSLRFEVNFSGRTVTVTPPTLVHTFGGFRPATQYLTGAQLSDPYFAAVMAAVTATGNAAQAALLLELLTAGQVDGQFALCDGTNMYPSVPNVNFIPLTETMDSLLQQAPTVDPGCTMPTKSASFLYNIEVQNAKVPNSLVTLTITDPNAATTTTTTTTSVAADPVAPAFTG
jgi:hypothetical protein